MNIQVKKELFGCQTLYLSFPLHQDGFMDFFDKDKARERVQDTVSSLVTSVCKYAAFGAGLAAIACLLRR